jgi:hypothetical protein
MNTKPRALYIVMWEPTPEQDFQWPSDEHIAARLALPGFISHRRFRSAKGDPRFIQIYEIEGPEVFETPEYKKLNAGIAPIGQDSELSRANGVRLRRRIYIEE